MSLFRSERAPKILARNIHDFKNRQQLSVLAEHYVYLWHVNEKPAYH